MPEHWARPLLVLTVTAVVAAVAGIATGLVVRWLARVRRRPFLLQVHRDTHRAWIATLVSLAVMTAVPTAGLTPRWRDLVGHTALIASIASVAWLVVKALVVVQYVAFRRYRVDVRDNLRNRRMRTQLDLVRRIGASIVTVVAAASILLTFGPMRTLGTSLLASAGVAGVVAGLAAQTTLGNVFAGLQLVFSDALRLDDVVVVEEEWGRIEELTLTYVVVHLWDERRLVLPTSYFTSQPFQNWTRSESRILGSVMLYVDPAVPIDRMRAEAQRVIEENPLWDRRDWVLQVVDVTERAVVVRILASASDAASSWDLRCDIREHMVGWMQREAPQSLVRTRAEMVHAVADGAAAPAEARPQRRFAIG